MTVRPLKQALAGVLTAGVLALAVISCAPAAESVQDSAPDDSSPQAQESTRAEVVGRGGAGSVSYPEGRTILVTVLATDRDYYWADDPIDALRKQIMYNNIAMACDYLEQQADAWGKDLTFIYNTSEDSDLWYPLYTRGKIGGEDGMADDVIWTYIDTYIPSDELLEKYDAVNILYILLFNSQLDNTHITATRAWYEDMPYPYEYIDMYYIDSGAVNAAAVYAHEILHTFGAPDLYMPYDGDGVTEYEVNWVAQNRPNDIMYTCSDQTTGTYVYDDITNDVTDITAWYLGWTDEEPDGVAPLNRVHSLADSVAA